MPQFDDSYSERLAELHRLEEERIIQARATQIGFQYIDLHGYTINPNALAIIPEAESKAANVVAFDVTHKTLSVATPQPTHPDTQATMQRLGKDYEIQLFVCSPQSLTHAQVRYQDITNSTAAKKGVFDISTDDIERFAKQITSPAAVADALKTVNTLNNARRITETMEIVFAGALSLRSSDIHIEPEETGIRLRYRLDGVLHDIASIDRQLFSRLMSRLKLLAGMTLNRRLEAQDGRFTFNTAEKEIEVRASVIPGAIGESIVMRLLDPSVAGFSMAKLEMNHALQTVMEYELKRPNGLIITTGPTGSGKTTALYAFLRETHTEGVKIITIENPVEYKVEGVVQTQTGDDYTFASGLRAILRQDPDIIMVGEIRDHEVAETAIHAAQTGHLVFSTLHTNSAIGAFPRLIDLGVDPRIIGSAINIVLGQRLVRRLCTACKKPYRASATEVDLITQVMATHPHPTPISNPLQLYQAHGCEVCNHTGFKGRVGVFEAVQVDVAVEEAVIRDPREHIIRQAAKPQGIPSMVEDGIDKVLAGMTSLTELERVISLPRQAAAPAVATDPSPEPNVDTVTTHTVSL
jgi:type IV pilus assembly protein PilB